MPWLRPAMARPPFPEVQPLPSATDGAGFNASITARYRPGRTRHSDRDCLVRYEVMRVASAIAREWEADQHAAAQDAINARLGEPRNCAHGFYRQLTARVELSIDPAAREAAVKARQDRAHVKRLQYLKTALYADPSLLAVEYLERNPDKIGAVKVNEFRRFADQLRAAEHWWSPVMAAWSELAAETRSREACDEVLRVLLDTIRTLDARLATRHALPITTETGTFDGRAHSD